jgi:hypothetical protein
MSVNILQPFITCSNNDIDCCALFKKLIVTDSIGNVYINGLFGLTGSKDGTFTAEDLQTVIINGESKQVLAVNHNFDLLAGFGLLVVDGSNTQQAVTYYVVDSDNIYIIIDGTVTGTWYYKIFK